MDNQYEHLDLKSRIPAIIDAWRDNPTINIAEEARKYNMQLVYPMLVVFDDKEDTYEKLILNIINHIKTKYGTINPRLTLPYSLFFIFLNVDDSRKIKTQVLQWISQQQPLMP